MSSSNLYCLYVMIYGYCALCICVSVWPRRWVDHSNKEEVTVRAQEAELPSSGVEAQL